MKRFFMYLLIVLLTISITGCVSDKDDVKLKSEREVVCYATEEFGKASVAAVEKNEEANYVIYELQDEELGFRYSVKSCAVEVVFDAMHTGRFIESTTNNFEENYQHYMLEQLDLENICNRTITTNRAGHEMLFSLIAKTEEALKSEIPPIIDEIKRADRRGYFREYCVGIYDEDERYLGSCAISSGEFTNCYEEYIEQMTRHFAGATNKNSGDLDGITYLYYERLPYKDVEGLKLEWLSRENVSADDLTTAYYFDYYGETYFMLDDKVFIIDEEGMVQNHYDKNYTNYWFVEG